MQQISMYHAEIDSKSPAVFRFGLVIAACLSLLAVAACTVSSKLDPVTPELALVDNTITNSVKHEGVDPSDAVIIKSVVVETTDTRNIQALAWRNPETGSKGTITAIDKFTHTEGQKCKKFQTTVDTFMGISLYNGETCELKRGLWVLSWFVRDSS